MRTPEKKTVQNVVDRNFLETFLPHDRSAPHEIGRDLDEMDKKDNGFPVLKLLCKTL